MRVCGNRAPSPAKQIKRSSQRRIPVGDRMCSQTRMANSMSHVADHFLCTLYMHSTGYEEGSDMEEGVNGIREGRAG